MSLALLFLIFFFTLFDWEEHILGSDRTWADIEGVLLLGFDESSISSFNYNSCFECYDSIEKQEDWSFYKHSYAHQIMAQYLKYIFKETIISYRQYEEYIIRELERFSINFSKYVNSQIKEHDDYFEKAQNLIIEITGVGLNECEILSFNYTEPITDSNLINMHGKAKREKVVFGITCGETDKEKINTHKSWRYYATKEYGIANLSASGIKVSANYKDVEDIYVFGSSLGSQDYDFFENLFDSCDFLSRLYSSRIHFCFSEYDGKTK